MTAPVRLVVLQGPTQAVAAAAALRHRPVDEEFVNVALVVGLGSERASDLRDVTLACSPPNAWDRVLPHDAVETVQALTEATRGLDVRELLMVRNWQTDNETVIEAFPTARRVIYGDAFGLLNPETGPDKPSFEEATALIPYPADAEVLRGVELTPVAPSTVLDVISEVRAQTPGLVASDARLAEFAQGGLLLLTHYMTECRQSTYRAEVRHLLRLVRDSGTPAGSPVVIKPHPRNTMGQIGSLARILRSEGRPVRILSHRDHGAYPMEVFSQLASSVAVAAGGASTSIVTMQLLYGTTGRITDDYASHWWAFEPSARRRHSAQTAGLQRQLEVLSQWDGTSPMQPPPAERARATDRLHDQLWKFFTWRPTAGVREAAWWSKAPAALLERLSAASRRSDHEPPGKGLAPLDESSLAKARALRPGATVEITIPVGLSTHAPLLATIAFRVFGVPPGTTSLPTPEDVEAVLERDVDVLSRSPEPFSLRTALRLGQVRRVRFVVRGRARTASTPEGG